MTAMWLVSLCAIVLSFARVNVGDNSDNLFIFPTAPGPSNNFVADLLWALGSTQKIQWSTTVDSYHIALFQQATDPASGNPIQTIYNIDNNGTGQELSFNWQVETYNTNLSFSPVYFLWLNPGESGFTSHYFNITNQAQSSSSSSPSISSSSTAFTSSTSLPTSMIASSTSSTSPQRTSDATLASPSSTASSSTDTVKVGLGVGLGIGIPLVLIAGIWIGLQSVKQRKSSSRSMGSAVPLSQFRDNDFPPDPYPPPGQPIHDANKIYEAPGSIDQCHEAPGDGSLIELGSREY